MNTQTLEISRIAFEEAIPLLEAHQLPTDDLNESVVLYGAFQGSDLVGVAGFELYEKVGLLRSVAISEAYQQHGIGRSLIPSVEKEAEALLLSELWLLTTSASGFFAKLGYEQMDRSLAPLVIQQHPQFTALCPSSAVCMKKML